jgi:hypothetical protein
MAIRHGQQAYGCGRVAGKLAPLFPQRAAAKLTPTQGHGEHLLSHAEMDDGGAMSDDWADTIAPAVALPRPRRDRLRLSERRDDRWSPVALQPQQVSVPVIGGVFAKLFAGNRPAVSCPVQLTRVQASYVTHAPLLAIRQDADAPIGTVLTSRTFGALQRVCSCGTIAISATAVADVLILPATFACRDGSLWRQCPKFARDGSRKSNCRSR